MCLASAILLITRNTYTGVFKTEELHLYALLYVP